jgi:hypothetical protein
MMKAWDQEANWLTPQAAIAPAMPTRHERRPVGALLAWQALDHQGDPHPQFARQAESGNHAQHLELSYVGDKGVEQRGAGIDDDRTEQRRQPAPAIGDHAPGETANQHPDHLQTEQVGEGCCERLLGYAERQQAVATDHADQHDVVDVDEIAERGDDNREGQQPGVGHGARMIRR